MVKKFGADRLEEVLAAAWREKESSACLWWQGEWWSWERLETLTSDCEGKLRRSGFCTGQRLAVMLPNSPMVIALSVACWRLGGAIAPLNVRTGALNLVDTIKMLDVSAVVLTKEAFAATDGFPEDIPLVPVSPEGPLPEWRGRVGTADSRDVAVIFSTSGTSGKPKAVTCLHSNLLGNLAPIDEHVPGLLAEDAVFLNVLPNFHTFGYNVAGMLPLAYGRRQTLVPTFVPVDATIRTMIDSGVNRLIAVPTIIAFLIGALAKKDIRLNQITHIISGGDRFNVQLEDRCREYLGVGVLEGYGLTETSPVIAVNSTQETKKLGTVGRPYPDYGVEIRDRDGKLLDIHEEGVLWVKGPSVVPGYFRDEANTTERFHDGWLNTGDVVRIDADGFISIVDRATDIIIVGGFNVYPQEVEAVLCSHPSVHAAVAVGEKNKITGELVKAFIILEDGMQVSPKELTEYCRERLAHYKVPRKIGFVTEYPVSPSGKILRRELRKMKIEKQK